MKHLFGTDPFSIHRGGGAIPIAQAMAGQRLLRLRLPLPRAPENVTVCEEPLTDTPLAAIRHPRWRDAERLRALKQGRGSRGILQGSMLLGTRGGAG